MIRQDESIQQSIDHESIKNQYTLCLQNKWLTEQSTTTPTNMTPK